MSTTPHRGYLYERVHHNPLEAAFAKHWEEQNLDGNLLHKIANKESFTRSECYVAASVVQWLGSNVGTSFVESCLLECGHSLNWMSYKYSNEPLIDKMYMAQAPAEARQMVFDLAEAH